MMKILDDPKVKVYLVLVPMIRGDFKKKKICELGNMSQKGGGVRPDPQLQIFSKLGQPQGGRGGSVVMSQIPTYILPIILFNHLLTHYDLNIL